MVQEQHMDKSFDNIKIVPFLRAIQMNDPKSIGLDKSTFESLVREYMKIDKVETILEKRARHYYDKIFIVKGALFVLSKQIGDKEMIEVLKDQGYTLRWDYYFDDIKAIADAVGFEEMKLDEVKAAMPKKPKKKTKDSEKINTFDILTSVSTGLELSLNFNTMVVNEFLSYRSQLQRKVARLDKQNKAIKSNKK